METPVRPIVPAVNRGSRQSTESKALLSQCRDLARSKLGHIVAEALDKVENDLFSAAEASTSRAEQQVLFEAMAQVKTPPRRDRLLVRPLLHRDLRPQDFDPRFGRRRRGRASPASAS